MLTEQEIQRSWRRIFDKTVMNDEKFIQGEELLEQMRPESPLRHRLQTELNDMRKMVSKPRK